MLHASKPNLIDAMNILLKVWKRPDKYCTEDGIKRCWLRANCLPTDMQAQIQTEVEPSKDHIAQYRLPDMELNALCSSMLALRASVEKLPTVPPALNESYSDCRSSSVPQNDLREMMELWCSVEDLPEVINQELEEAIEELEQLAVDSDEDMDLGAEDAVNADARTVTSTCSLGETALSLLSPEEMNNFISLLEKVRKDSFVSKESRRLAFSLETQIHADRLKRRAHQTSLRSYFDTR